MSTLHNLLMEKSLKNDVLIRNWEQHVHNLFQQRTILNQIRHGQIMKLKVSLGTVLAQRSLLMTVAADRMAEQRRRLIKTCKSHAYQ